MTSIYRREDQKIYIIENPFQPYFALIPERLHPSPYFLIILKSQPHQLVIIQTNF